MAAIPPTATTPQLQPAAPPSGGGAVVPAPARSFLSFDASRILQQRFIVFILLLVVALVGFWILYKQYDKTRTEIATLKRSNDELTHKLHESNQMLAFLRYDDEEELPVGVAAAPQPPQKPKKKEKAHEAGAADISPLVFMMRAAMGADEEGDMPNITELETDDEDQPPPQPTASAAEQTLNGMLGGPSKAHSEPSAPKKDKTKKQRPQTTAVN